ncbi:unnamed protein product [Thelazia callipaeda]|uniref:Cytochrome P450 n=1 Tax=Thelazia callipaeda TaxID=103827 RepID=A0A0N5CYJ9_THECL|nr:unnamed protein product [Thelazia callipaeda]
MIKYWKAWNAISNCGFPIVSGENWFLGNLNITKSCDTHRKLMQLTRKYGPIYGLMQGSHPVVVISDPKIIHEICFKQFHIFHSRIMDPTGSHPDIANEVHQFAARGERWKRIRSLTSKAVSSENLRKFSEIMKDSIERFILDLESEIIISKALDLHARFQRLTFDVITRCCMGRPYSCQHDDPNLKLLLNKFSPLQTFHASFLFTWCIPDLKWIALIYEQLCVRVQSFLHITSDPIISYTSHLREIISRNISDQECSSFLYFMKSVEDEKWKDWMVNADGPCDLSKVKIISKLTRGEIVNQCRFLTSAGFDTTANTATYLVYLLARYPKEQEKLWEEISILDEFTFENVRYLNYLHCAIMETLRLFPHASLLQTRTCTQKCRIGTYTFRDGVGILFDTWTLHYDSKIWGEDVHKFHPDRFLFLHLTEAQRNSWMAFGAGPRQCIGMRFAVLEIKLLICHLMKKFQFHEYQNTNKASFKSLKSNLLPIFMNTLQN